MTRTPAQIGRANRRNGRDTERAVRDHLRQWWPDLDYLHPGGHQRTAGGDRGDLGPLIDRDGDAWTVEIKGPRSTPMPGDVDRWAAEAAAESEAAGTPMWVLIVRRPGTADVGRWWAWVDVGTFGWIATAGDLACVPVRTWVALTAPEDAQ